MNLKIRGKIMASVGSVVVLLAVLGILAIINLGSIRSEFEGLLLATDVERGAFNTILAEKGYLLFEDNKYYEEAKKQVDVIDNSLDEIDATSSNEELLANSKQAREGTNKYAELYHKGVAALKQNAEGAVFLQDAGQAVTDQAEAFVNDKRKEAENTLLMQQINVCTEIWKFALQIRMKEKEYMLYQKAEDFETMKEDFVLMMAELDELEKISPDARDQERIRIARENATKYEQAAYTWVDDRKELTENILPQMQELGDNVITVAQQAATGASENMIATQESSNFILVIGMIVGLVVGMGIAFVMGGKFSKPINGVVDMIKDIAQGEGDLTKRLKSDSKDEIGDLANWFNTFMDKLHDIIAAVAGNTEQLASAANEISSASEELSTGVKEQTNQTGQVTTAVEEMTATIVESTKNIADANDKAKTAGEKSQEGSSMADEASRGMDEIVESSNVTSKNIEGLSEKATAIGEIISVIDDIADQTNLLALNAAIEAARAGEQGRGFAVVADEVRKLAERTTSATKEVADNIKGIQADVNTAATQVTDSNEIVSRGKEAAQKTNDALNEIYTAIEAVQGMMNQISTASEEQSTAAEQISKNVENVDRITKETATGSEQAASAAEQLNRQAEELRNLVGGFKLRKNTQTEVKVEA